MGNKTKCKNLHGGKDRTSLHTNKQFVCNFDVAFIWHDYTTPYSFSFISTLISVIAVAEQRVKDARKLYTHKSVW